MSEMFKTLKGLSATSGHKTLVPKDITSEEDL